MIITRNLGLPAGSTSGGIKVIRVLLLLKQSHREFLTLIHPKIVVLVKLNGRPIGKSVIHAVWGFFALYVFSTTGLTLLMMGTGLDVVSAFSAVTACINTLGPGLGEVAGNFATVSPLGQWILIFTMLLGRLELFTLLVLLTPTFWRK